ncbi:hypothetical protein U9M48_038321 [Paspalum notatum var. saurae]|uniref:Uncharacterized protein n=1 Tax=Paspalum notatum var. saurae TaxID=547442 RepID=A0AAQ3UIA7_PASNO
MICDLCEAVDESRSEQRSFFFSALSVRFRFSSDSDLLRLLGPFRCRWSVTWQLQPTAAAVPVSVRAVVPR